MVLSNHDQARIREYLLGQLSDEEQQKIEERLMVDDDLFDELEISKGELIEEYCAGELTPPEQDWFEHHYLASPEGRERHTFTLALGCLQQPTPVPAAPERLTFIQRLELFFKRPGFAVATATALALVVVVGIGTWRFWPWRFYEGSRVQVPVNLVSSASNRSDGNEDPVPPRVTLPPNANELRASLSLPRASTPDIQSYRAELDDRTETKTVKVVEHNASSVVVVIPASDLPRGEYELKLTAIKTDGTEEPVPGSYRFDVR